MPKVTQKNNLIKYCRVCNCELLVGNNCTEYRIIHQQYICKYCNNKINNDIHHNNPESANRACNKWKEKNRIKVNGYNTKWMDNNPEMLKECWRKSYAKRKGYDSIFLFDNPYPDSVPVVGHHASDGFVFYIPTILHLKHLHGKYIELHRDELQSYIEDIYNISYIIITN